MRPLLPVAAAVAVVLGGGSACAMANRQEPARTVAVITTPATDLAPDAPETLELTISAPPGAQIVVSTPDGQVIGHLARYVSESNAVAPVTYTLALPPGIDGGRLRSVRIQPSEGVRASDVQVGAAVVRARPD